MRCGPRGEYILTYRLHWGTGIPNPEPLARPVRTSIGAGPEETRLFVIDFVGDNLKPLSADAVRGLVLAEKGELRNIVAQPNPATGGWRLNFQLQTQKETLIELRAQLLQKDNVLSETWVYRWTA